MNKIVSSTTERILSAAGILLGTTGISLVSYFNPATARFFPVCPLYSLTGIACPGCGLTRGFHALFHGDVLTALDFNAMLPFYLFLFGYFFVSLGFTVLRGRGLSWRVFSPVAMYGFLIVALAFTILRNFPVYPFTVLAP